ncbi:HypC/HybG/HupF family hydrogenase formation chaperone [Paludibacterium yongneupense]|uniref:HypC/HybG/HupF family hydrogenase formation chaperone n=1 Tax=Paludibacterium yongneupense TaxID=400061 RepID=UPI0004014B3F|nr:HypC/HybG/HupF family hydrogenase formation chaperone [Paludibacterium yongneupense]
MCLAIPARVTALCGDNQARIELGGVQKEVSIALLDQVAVGDYVIVHVGFAIGKLDEAEALRTLALINEMGAPDTAMDLSA